MFKNHKQIQMNLINQEFIEGFTELWKPMGIDATISCLFLVIDSCLFIIENRNAYECPYPCWLSYVFFCKVMLIGPKLCYDNTYCIYSD